VSSRISTQVIPQWELSYTRWISNKVVPWVCYCCSTHICVFFFSDRTPTCTSIMVSRHSLPEGL